MSALRSVFLSIALTLLGVFIGLGVIEFSYRWFVLAGNGSSWSDRPTFYYKPERSLTLQDYHYPRKKPSGSYRIAVVGDSFTFATSMQFDDAYPKKLERLLQRSGAHPAVEVINYGVPGHSTAHEMKSVGIALRQRANFVLLQITLNDPEYKPYLPTGISEENRFGRLQPSGALGELSAYWKSLGFVLERIHNTRTVENYIKYYHDLFEKPHTWDSFEASLLTIHRAVRKADASMGVVIFPLFGVPIDDEYPFRALHTKLHALLERREIKYLDLLDTFQGVSLARLQVSPGEDFHPNEIGHRMAAEAIFDWLVEQDVSGKLVLRNRFSARPSADRILRRKARSGRQEQKQATASIDSPR